MNCPFGPWRRNAALSAGLKRQRVEGRDSDGDRDRQRELVIESASDARNEGDGNENGHQHRRRGDDRPGHLRHGFSRRLKRRQTGFELALDILHHDDRVVDDEADGEHHAEQAQHVEREAEDLHHRQRRDERNGNGDRRE